MPASDRHSRLTVREIFHNFNQRPVGFAEKITLLIYTVSVIVITYFHEPWFDEAQAWQIARDASLYDILFTIPHYEGHPPLWYLILMPFAKSGMPYEFSLKLIMTLTITAAMYVLLFHSPFPRIIKVFLPFTYFFFYQYAVIARPYGLLILMFFLAALVYPDKEKKPGLYALMLGIMSVTCAYGLLFAGSLGLCWLIERLIQIRQNQIRISTKEQSTCVTHFLSRAINDKSIHRMIILLSFLILVVLEILPRLNTYATEKMTGDTSPILMFFYNFFGLPVETIFADTINKYVLLNRYQFQPVLFAAEVFVGIFFIGGLLLYGWRKRKLIYLLIPLGIFSLFCAYVYIYLHHIGLEFVVIVFYLWICGYTKKTDERSIKNPVFASPHLKRIGKCTLILGIAIMCVFSEISALHEIIETYGYGRGVASFIKEYNLTDYKIMGSWGNEDTNAISQAVTYLPYFDSNINYNSNADREGIGYDTHIVTDDDENELNHMIWITKGPPDVLIGKCDLSEIYTDGSVTNSDYILVKRIRFNYVFKTSVFYSYIPIYMKKDLAKKLGLSQIFDPFEILW